MCILPMFHTNWQFDIVLYITVVFYWCLKMKDNRLFKILTTRRQKMTHIALSAVKLLLDLMNETTKFAFKVRTRATLAYVQCCNRGGTITLRGKHRCFKAFSLIAIICSTLKTLQKQASHFPAEPGLHALCDIFRY